MNEANTKTIKITQSRGNKARSIEIKIQHDDNPTYEAGVDSPAAAALWFVDVRDNGRRLPPMGGYIERTAAAAFVSDLTAAEAEYYCDQY